MGRRKSSKKYLISISALNKLLGIEDLSPYENILIKDLPFSNRVINQLGENNCTTLAELLSFSPGEISKFNYIGATSITNIFDTLKKYFNVNEIKIPEELETKEKISESEPETLKEIAAYIIKVVCKHARYFEVLYGRANGKILKEIGDSFGCTRERIRQIEFSAVKKFSNFCRLKVEKFLKLMKDSLGEKTIITINDLTNATDETTAKIFLYLFSKSDFKEDFFYDEITNTIIIRQEKAEPVNYEKYLEQLPDFMFEDELQAALEKVAQGEKIVVNALRAKIALKYHHIGKFWYKIWLSMNFHCGYILKTFFKEGYKIDNLADYNRFMKLLREHFGENICLTQRALDAKISTFIGVLCARGKYTHPDYINIPPEIIDTIRNFIDNSERNAFLYKEIFERLKDKLAGTQITNHYLLQGVIKFYKMPYILKKDLLSKSNKTNLVAEINSFVRERGKVSFDDIQNNFVGLDYSNIMLAVKKSSEVIFMGGGKYLHVDSLNLRENDFTYVENKIRQLCQNSPVSSRYLFELFKKNFSDFLSRNRIETYEEILGIVKYMFGEKFKYSRPYIFIDDAPPMTHKKVFLQYFEGTDKITVEQLLNFCDENKIRYAAKNYLIENLKPEFILIDKKILVRPEKIGVTDEVIFKVVEILKNAVNENGGWFAARKFANFELLPPLAVEWNSFLLENVAALSDNLKILHLTTSMRDLSSAVFVDEKFADYKFEEFLLKVLIDEHNRRTFKTYAEILNWLQDKGLCNLTLPKFLFLEEHLSFDSTGRIILK